MGSDEAKKTNSLFEYLRNNEQNESLVLSKEISFHWANWNETSVAMKLLVETQSNKKLLSFLDNSLNELKDKPVWLCNKMKSIKSSYYALYESYLDSRLKLTWFDRDEEILYSDNSEQGPFNSLSSMKWFSKEYYEQFVQRKILSDRYPLRAFRMTIELNLSMKFDNYFEQYDANFKLHQLSEAGVLIRVKDRNFINKIKNSQLMEIDFPVLEVDPKAIKMGDELTRFANHFKITDNMKYLKFSISSDVLNKYSNMQNSKRASSDEFYLFARFEDFKGVDHDHEMKSLYFDFVVKFKKIFMEHLQDCGLMQEGLIGDDKGAA